MGHDLVDLIGRFEKREVRGELERALARTEQRRECESARVRVIVSLHVDPGVARKFDHRGPVKSAQALDEGWSGIGPEASISPAVRSASSSTVEK